MNNYYKIIFDDVKNVWNSHRSDPSVEQISDHLLFRLFEIATPICSDNDKVRTNAARILGNLLRLINQNQITMEKWQNVCIEAMQKLCDQAKLNGTNSNMKVKWNACYAIGNFMKNTILFDLYINDFCWQVRIKNLTYLLCSENNYLI